MWSIEVSAPVSEVYQKLQEAFDEEHVPKEDVDFTVVRRNRPTQTHKKSVNVPDELSAKQFRYLLKGIQNSLAIYSGQVTVNMMGDDNSMSVRIEGKYA